MQSFKQAAPPTLLSNSKKKQAFSYTSCYEIRERKLHIMLIKPKVKEEIRKAITEKIKPDQDKINQTGTCKTVVLFKADEFDAHHYPDLINDLATKAVDANQSATKRLEYIKRHNLTKEQNKFWQGVDEDIMQYIVELLKNQFSTNSVYDSNYQAYGLAFDLYPETDSDVKLNKIKRELNQAKIDATIKQSDLGTLALHIALDDTGNNNLEVLNDNGKIKLHLGTISWGEEMVAIITEPYAARKLEKITHIVTKYL